MPSRRALLSAPTGATRVAGIVGDPVHHSLSPVLHNAAFAATGIDWVYVAFHVAAGHGAAAVEAMRTLDLAGLSVTMPHKAEAAAAVDHLGPTASRLGVVNTISWSRTSVDSELTGESTDGSGFLDSLRGDEGFDPTGRACIVLGTGGAARAVTLALADAGAGRITVVGRNAAAAASCAGLADDRGRTHTAPGSSEDLRNIISSADLLVNATPAGMLGDGSLPFGLTSDWLWTRPFVADLVYAPAAPPLLLAARAVGAPGCNGLGMLIHQAARQFELWTGRPAPIEAMSAAVVATLTHHED